MNEITVTIYFKEGETISLLGDQAKSVYQQYLTNWEQGNGLIQWRDEDGAHEIRRIECTCGIKVVTDEVPDIERPCDDFECIPDNANVVPTQVR